MNKINVQNLQKRYPDQVVLSDVSFTVDSGEIVALLGDSGAGKSTLLRCLNLLEQPDAGRLMVNNLTFDFSGHKKRNAYSRQVMMELRTKVGMVFQQFHLWPHRTVLQNLIEAPMQVLKMPKIDAIAKADLLLERMAILDKKNQYPAKLSGGQQQRAAIARALMMEPDIILFDEPTSGLDPKMVVEVKKLIQTLADKGMTIVIATHEMNFTYELADKTIFLHQGKIIEQGATHAMFQAPQTSMFKEFIQSVRY